MIVVNDFCVKLLSEEYSVPSYVHLPLFGLIVSVDVFCVKYAFTVRSAVTVTVSVDLYSVPFAVPSLVHFTNVQPDFVGFFGQLLLLAITAPYVLSYRIVFAFVSAYADAAEPSRFHPFHVPPFSLNVIVY